MADPVLTHAALLLLGTFVASVSQAMLKGAAMRPHGSLLGEYLDPLVIAAYLLLFGTTVLSTLAYRGIPLSMGPILEATSYLYVTVFGATIFKERLTRRKAVALALILLGIAIFSLGV